jgi:hypothetical protein
MNRVTIACSATAFAALMAYGHASVFAQKSGEPRRYRIAAARADGVIVPFAEHEDGAWRPVWTGTENSGSPVLPMTLHDVEPRWWGKDGPALTWWLWQRPSVAEEMTVTAPRAVAAPCTADVGLATNYTPAAAVPAATVTPYPKAGLATTATINYQPIVPLQRDSPVWQRVRRAASREFPWAEEKALFEMQWGHPTSKRERNAAPFDLQNVWHVPGGRFYYFEAMRRYPEKRAPRGEEPCDLVTYAAGYLWEGDDGELLGAGVDALISYCHLERAMFMWPLGAIREGARQYWVMQMAGWNSESYSIVELDPSRRYVRPRLTHHAGSCRLE